MPVKGGGGGSSGSGLSVTDGVVTVNPTTLIRAGGGGAAGVQVLDAGGGEADFNVNVSDTNWPTSDEKAALDAAAAPTGGNPFATIADGHSSGQIVVTLTNKSGASVALGDVVILDSSTASSFTTTASAAQIADWVGVAQETIANNASGRVLLKGYTSTLNLVSAASLGDYVRTHSVAKQAQRFATTGAGDFGQVLATGTTPAAIIWGRPDQGVPVSDAVYGAGWNGVVDVAPSKNAVYDKIETLGGTTQIRSTYAARPAAGTAGRIWLSTEEDLMAFDDGAAWHNYYRSHGVFLPADPGTWDNQNGSTISLTTGLAKLHVAPTATIGVTLRHGAIGVAAPWTIKARLKLFGQSAPNADFVHFGLGLRSTAGLITEFALYSNGATIDVRHWTNSTTFGATAANPRFDTLAPFLPSYNPSLNFRWPVDLKIVNDNAGNLIFSISADGGETWKQVLSETIAGFMIDVPNYGLIGSTYNGNVVALDVAYESLVITTP